MKKLELQAQNKEINNLKSEIEVVKSVNKEISFSHQVIKSKVSDLCRALRNSKQQPWSRLNDWRENLRVEPPSNYVKLLL